MIKTHHASDGALLNLGKRESGAERLEQAVAAFTEALKERTRERVPPSTGPRRETTAKFRRVDPGERIIHDNGTYRAGYTRAKVMVRFIDDHRDAYGVEPIRTVFCRSLGERFHRMELLTGPAVWIGTIVVAVFGTWLKLFFGQFLPSPQQVRLAIANAFKTRSPRPEQRFRLALCWLENDRAGRDTGTVAEAFTGVEGIELVRFHRVVSASGAADVWRPAMRRGALAVLKTWNADLAIVGSVKDSGKALSLWFVPREGDGTLRRGDLPPYELVNVRLQDDFHDDLRAQLTAEALRVAAPLAGTEMRGRVLEKGLNDVTEKIAALLKGGAVESARRASLHMVLGNALATLGERERGTERFEQAVAAYTEALKERPRERVPLDWAMTQNNLGAALVTLGKRERGTERLEQAVAAFTEALKERPRERVPLDWAMTQNNLGAALVTLGKRERGTERLEQAVAAFTEALKERPRERVPLDWAMTQSNLGTALVTLGKRERGTERLEQAVAAFTEALKERPRERVPLDWAMTQSNLGNALVTLGSESAGQSALSRPWPPLPRRSKSAPASGCPSTGL